MYYRLICDKDAIAFKKEELLSCFIDDGVLKIFLKNGNTHHLIGDINLIKDEFNKIIDFLEHEDE